MSKSEIEQGGKERELKRKKQNPFFTPLIQTNSTLNASLFPSPASFPSLAAASSPPTIRVTAEVLNIGKKISVLVK